MPPEDLDALAAQLLDASAYITLATADADGRPWATPVWFALAADGGLYWVSRPDARHSRNLAVRPELAMVVFDSTVPIGTGRAIYLEGTAGLVADDGLEAGLAVFSERALAQGGRTWTAEDVTGTAEHRLYRAEVGGRWVLDDRDQRLPVGG